MILRKRELHPGIGEPAGLDAFALMPFARFKQSKSVMARALKIAFVAAALWSNGSVASADEQLLPPAMSGNWVALAHRSSMMAAADVCLVVNDNATNRVALRAGMEGLQFRVSNPTWSLPARVQGTITIQMGDWKTTLEIDDNTDVMVNAEIATELIVPLFAAMDKAASMTITLGNAKPFQISLSGSMRATNASRTCAGIEGNTKGPGSNPFQ